MSKTNKLIRRWQNKVDEVAAVAQWLDVYYANSNVEGLVGTIAQLAAMQHRVDCLKKRIICEHGDKVHGHSPAKHKSAVRRG